MYSKLGFILTLILVIVLHDFFLKRLRVKESSVALPVKAKIAKTINIQQVVIKKPPPPVVKEVVREVVPEVVPIPVVEKKVIKKVVKKRKKVKKRVKKVKKKFVPKKEPEVEVVPVPEIVEPVVPEVPRISTARLAQVKESYLSRVRMVIESHKKYPRISKRLRQEGVVNVEFTIQKSGKIRSARVKQGCKYQKLNQAAVAIFDEIGSFEPIPDEIERSSWKISVPVAYKILVR